MRKFYNRTMPSETSTAAFAVTTRSPHDCSEPVAVATFDAEDFDGDHEAAFEAAQVEMAGIINEARESRQSVIVEIRADDETGEVFEWDAVSNR